MNWPIEEELDGPEDALLHPLGDEETPHDGHVSESGQGEVHHRVGVVAGPRGRRLHVLNTPGDR